MKVLLSFILGVALVSYTLNMKQGAERWAPKIMNMWCLNPANSGASENLHVAYTVLSTSALDRIICFHVNFNQRPLYDLLGAPLM